MAVDRRDWESIRQKGESATGSVFAIKVEIRDPKTGEKHAERRFVAQFRAFDYRGKLVTYKSTKHSTEAKAWRAMPDLQARAIAAKQPPQKAEREQETVAQYLDRWHKRRVKTEAIRHLTAVNEKRHVDLVSSMELGQIQLRDVTVGDVEQFLGDLEDRLAGKRRAQQQVFQVVRAALRSAPRGTWLSSPLDGISPPKAPRAVTKTFRPEELALILEASQSPLPDQTVVDEEFAALGNLCRTRPLC